MKESYLRLSALFSLVLMSPVIFAENTAKFFHQQIVAQKLPEAAYALESKDYKKALDIYKALAEQGEPIAQYQLGYIYQNEEGLS